MGQALGAAAHVTMLVLALLVSTYWFGRASGSLALADLNLVSFNLYYRLIPCAIGAGLLTGGWGLTGYYMVDRFPVQNAGFVCNAVSYSLVGTGLGTLLGGRVLNVDARRSLRSYLMSPVEGLRKPLTATALASCLTLISVLSMVYTLRSLGFASLVRAFGLSASEVASVRGLVKFAFPGNQYVRNFLATMLPTLLSYACWVWVRRTRQPNWLLLFVTNFVLAVLGNTMSLEKAPLVKYLCGFLFLEIGLRKVRAWSVLCVAVMGLCASVGLSWLTARGRSLGYYVQAIGYRLLLGSAVPLFFYPEVFPGRVGFLGGKAHPKVLAGLFGVEPIRAARIVMAFVNPSGVESNTAGYMSTLFVGEAYANWGWAGVLLAPWVVGLVTGVVYYWLLSRPKTPIWLAVYTYVALDLPTTGGFLDFLYNPGWLFLLVVSWVWWSVAEAAGGLPVAHGVVVTESRR